MFVIVCEVSDVDVLGILFWWDLGVLVEISIGEKGFYKDRRDEKKKKGR